MVVSIILVVESMSCSVSGAMRPRFLILGLAPLLALLCAASASTSMDVVKTFAGVQLPQPCPPPCQCNNRRRAQDIMQDHLTRHLPAMTAGMDPQLEPELRSNLVLLTSWLGNMAELQCHLKKDGDRLRLSDVVRASALSFKSVHVDCESGGSVVWDVSPSDAFLNVLRVSGCVLEKAADLPMMVLPPNIWVLELERVPAVTAQSLDFSEASGLRMFSFTHSHLTSVPQSWIKKNLQNLLFANLAHNSLSSFGCELEAPEMRVLNLDYNRLTALPECVLDGSRYSSHLSLRHNQISNVQELFFNKLQEPTADKPATTPPAEPFITCLDLAHNNVENVRVLKKTNKLLGLDLSNNNLENVVSDSFSLNPDLDWLDLSHNFLEHVSDDLLNPLGNLRHVNLSHNHLRSFSFDTKGLTSKLATLDLGHNRLMYPPFADMSYVVSRKVRVSAAHNPFLCDCNVHPFLQLHDSERSEMYQKVWVSLSSIYSFGVNTNSEPIYEDIGELTCAGPAEFKGSRLTSLNFQASCPLPRGCPKDCACNLRKDGTHRVSVDCSGSESLTELPEGLPFFPDTPLILFFNQTSLKRVDHRPYLYRLSEFYADQSKLSSVAPDAMMALENISVLDLSNNQLRSLPTLTKNLTLAAATNLSLSGNPWACGCKDLWMPAWLTKHTTAIQNMDQTRCHWTGKLVTELNSADLNCGLFDYLPFTIAVSLLSVFALVSLSIFSKYRLEVLVFTHKYSGLRPFNMFHYNDTKPALFDVFVSFSELDYKWVVEGLMEHLENRPKPYRVCTQLRDFPVGAPFADSVAWAMENSRCTLLVLSRDLLANEWTQFDIRVAHLDLLRQHPDRVLVVIHGPLDARCLDPDLLDYLKTRAYMRSEESSMWSKLDYALPAPQDTVFMMEPQDAAARPRKGGEKTGAEGGGQGEELAKELGGCFACGGLEAGDVKVAA